VAFNQSTLERASERERKPNPEPEAGSRGKPARDGIPSQGGRGHVAVCRIGEMVQKTPKEREREREQRSMQYTSFEAYSSNALKSELAIAERSTVGRAGSHWRST
jgi:hypothetical protein